MYRWLVFLAIHALVGLCAQSQIIGLEDRANTYNGLYHHASDCFDLSLVRDQDIAAPFTIESIAFTADCAIDSEEITYLTGLKSGQIVGARELQQAYFYLEKTQRFKKIYLTLFPGATPEQRRMHFLLEGNWRLAQVRFSGLWIDRDRYRQQYTLLPGDPFDEDQHEQSLIAIRRALARDGYLNARVYARMQRNYAQKTVATIVRIDRGFQFCFGSIALDIQGVDSSDEEHIEELRTRVFRRFARCVENRIYRWQLLNDLGVQLKHFLVREGYAPVTVAVREHIDFRRKMVALTFNVCVRKRVDICFIGNKLISSEQLMEQIMSAGPSVWHTPPTLLAQELKQWYNDQGFLEACVRVDSSKDAVSFVINEGVRGYIRSIEFVGVAPERRRILAKQRFIAALRNYGVSEQRVNQAKEALVVWYRRHGFLDATITGITFISTSYAGGYRLVITIAEGKQRIVRQVYGLPAFLSAKERLLVGQPFNGALIDRQREELVQHYAQIGIQRVRVYYTLQEENGSVDITWHTDFCDTGPSFGKTVIQGIPPLSFRRIMREVQQQEGSSWDGAVIERTFGQLTALDVFESIHQYPSRSCDLEGNRPVMLHLVPDPPREIKTRFGVQRSSRRGPLSTGSTYRFGLSYVWKNPLERADCLRIDVDVTRYAQEASILYRVPWIAGLPVDGHVSAYTDRYDQLLRAHAAHSLYRMKHDGVLIGCTSRYKPTGQIAGTCGIESVGILGLSAAAAQALCFCNRVEGHAPYFFTEVTAVVDNLDSKFNPTRGFFSNVQCKLSVPLSYTRTLDTVALRLLCEQSLFVPVIRRCVGALRLRVGHVFHRPLDTLVPSERFYLGGASTLRSYELDSAPPFGCFTDTADTAHAVPQGGSTMVNANIEMRIALFKRVGVVFFQDLGVLHGSVWSGLLSATGFGVRYQTPIGPIRFDVGFRHREGCSDSGYAWFLALGHAF